MLIEFEFGVLFKSTELKNPHYDLDKLLLILNEYWCSYLYQYLSRALMEIEKSFFGFENPKIHWTEKKKKFKIVLMMLWLWIGTKLRYRRTDGNYQIKRIKNHRASTTVHQKPWTSSRNHTEHIRLTHSFESKILNFYRILNVFLSRITNNTENTDIGGCFHRMGC